MKQDKNEFSSLLVEQLREQVGNLMAAAQLLTPAIREQEDRKYDQYLAILNQSMYRLLRLTEHVDFVGRETRGEEGVHRPAVMDATSFCRELCEQVVPLARQMKVTFVHEEEKNLLLSGDAVLLRRMVLNLVGNALQAAGEGGRAGLRLAAEGEWIRITVWDNSPGGLLPGAVNRADMELEEALKRRDVLGLGMEIAQEIAVLHGGTMIFAQRESQGMQVVVSLPVHTQSSETMRTPRTGYDSTGGFSQVLVELSNVLPYEAFLPDDVE